MIYVGIILLTDYLLHGCSDQVWVRVEAVRISLVTYSIVHVEVFIDQGRGGVVD